MAAKGAKAKKGAAKAAAVSVALPDGMAPEIVAAYEKKLSEQLSQIAECADEADVADGSPLPLAPALASPGGFRPGDDVEAPGEGEPGAALPTLDDAIRLILRLFDALRACSDRVRVQDERLARIRHVTFGYRSERLARTGLYDAIGDGADADDSDRDAAADAKTDDSATDNEATADGTTGDDAAADGNTADGGGDGKAKGEWPPKKKKEGRPRRTNGCARHVTESCVELTVHKKVDESVLEALRGQGYHLERLDDGRYEVVHMVDMAVRLTTVYEVWKVRETGERIAADRAADSKPLENSPLGCDVFADLLFHRYVLSQPAPRVAREAVVAGLGITKQTIYRDSTQFALSLASPITQYLLQHIIESELAQSDETWIKVRQEDAENGRQNSVMWAVCTSENDAGTHPAVVLTHTSTRSAEALAKILKGFEGKLMADGYKGYPRAIRLIYEALREESPDAEVRPIMLAGCLQHCRSKFFDVVQALIGRGEWATLAPPQMRRIPAVSMLESINRVFEAERGMDRDAPREARAEYRRTRVRPLLKKVLLKCHRYLQKKELKLDDYLYGALKYTWEQATMLFAAVDDPDVPLHNSQCERIFASFGVIRNASRQLDSSMGAWTLAQWFSIVRTARLNGADERIYLEYLFERGIPLLKEHGDWRWYEVPKDGGWKSFDLEGLHVPEDMSYLEALMPWSKEYKAYEAAWRERKRDDYLTYAKLIAEQVEKVRDAA